MAEAAYDRVIRGGNVVDGSGGEPFQADVAVKDGLIAQVGKVTGRGAEEIDARGMIVTPGFVDVHTHYDGQATWDERLQPSSWHGITTVVQGNGSTSTEKWAAAKNPPIDCFYVYPTVSRDTTDVSDMVAGDEERLVGKLEFEFACIAKIHGQR